MTPGSEGKNLFKELLGAARTRREAGRVEREREERQRGDEGTPWATYRRDIRENIADLEVQYPGSTKRIESLVTTLRKGGQRAVCVDICGEAGANDFFDTAVTFSTTSTEKEHRGVLYPIAGDIFSTRDQMKLKDALEASVEYDPREPFIASGKIAFINCDPVAGMAGEGEHLMTFGTEETRLYSLHQLKRLFDLLYRKLMWGGYLSLVVENIIDKEAIASFASYLKTKKIAFEYTEGKPMLISKPTYEEFVEEFHSYSQTSVEQIRAVGTLWRQTSEGTPEEWRTFPELKVGYQDYDTVQLVFPDLKKSITFSLHFFPDEQENELFEKFITTGTRDRESLRAHGGDMVFDTPYDYKDSKETSEPVAENGSNPLITNAPFGYAWLAKAYPGIPVARIYHAKHVAEGLLLNAMRERHHEAPLPLIEPEFA